MASRNNRSDKDKGILSQLGGAVKSVLPKKWFGSEEERQKIARREQVKSHVSGGIDEMLKDAPLGVRMFGKMMKPILGRAAAAATESMADLQRTTQQAMDDTRNYLMGDPAVTNLLGDVITVGMPFSQSQQSVIMNGKSQVRVQMALPVSGPKGSGTATLTANQDGIASLQLEAMGRRIDVNLTKPKHFKGPGSSFGGDDTIIEAEIIDKKKN